MRNQLSSQYQEPLISRLKKKNITLASKPLKIEQASVHNRTNKMTSSHHIADRIYFKNEEEKPATPRVMNNTIKIEKKEPIKQSVRR